MRKHGHWQIHDSREVHRDEWLSVAVDNVTRPDGKPGTFTVVSVKPGVCVLAVDGTGTAHLTEEFRYAIGRSSVEGVSGGIDPGETPEAAARRELKEELGIDARSWTDLGVVDPFTSMLHSPTRLFLAEHLSFGPPTREGTEGIRHVRLPLPAAVTAVLEGRITHAPTCTLLLKAALRAGTGEAAKPGLRDDPSVEMMGPRKARVVVIEDNRDAAESMRLLLDLLGCDVAVAHNGPAGVSAAQAMHPDVVFCDIGLPELDGFEVARRLRSAIDGHRMVLVAVTGYGGEETRRRAEAAGFDMHFVKPADPAGIARLFKDCGFSVRV
ncbi:MAG TPA: response regulator [Gemmataceae bacterium]|jgi:ADP-ribose pyrophosphatase|nr:response regulator [Gemmataceae bacterium]